MEKFDKSIFDFSGQVDISDEEYQAAIAPTPSIEPYKRSMLTILDIDLKGPVKSDPEWAIINFVFGFEGWTPKQEEADGKTKTVYYDDKNKKKIPLRHNLLIPMRNRAKFNGKNGETEYVFRNAQEFFAGLGLDLLPSNLGQVIGGFIKDIESLIGAQMDVLPGFSKNHVARAEDGSYYVADRNGKPLKLMLDGVEIPNSYSNRASAEGEAIACNVDIDSSKTFLEVLKFFPAEEPVKGKSRAKTTFDD
jgi:hypothetical protein